MVTGCSTDRQPPSETQVHKLNMLVVGRYVKIHSLASENAKKHNGKTAVIKTPLGAESGRCGIEPLGEGGNKLLSIKPANLKVLCSLCKMREEVTSPEPIVCNRCMLESYCSEECKMKHWNGGSDNKDLKYPNCHENWCIPETFEMEVPPKPIGVSNECDEAYDAILHYLQCAMKIGGSGRWNEERAMLLKLLEVDPCQPAAYNNLFVSCSELAQRSAKRPGMFEELSIEAIGSLTTGIRLILSEKLGKIDGAPGELETVDRMFIRVIHTKALPFMDECMRGVRGAENKMLEEMETCLMKCLVFLEKKNQSIHPVYMSLGVCLQKLKKFDDAVAKFTLCCDEYSKKIIKDKFYHQISATQIPQCYMSIAIHDQNKSPAEKIETLDMALSHFQKAVDLFKKDKNKEVFKVQHQLARCLYNKHAFMNNFARDGVMSYPDQVKNELFALMRNALNTALQGAIASANMVEVQAIKNLQNMAFN